MKDAKELIHYGVRYWLAELTQLLHVQAAPIFLGLVATESEIGIFATGLALTARVGMIPDALASLIQPRVAEDAGGRPELVAQSARLVGLTCLGLLLAMSLLSKPIVATLFSTAFLPAVPIIWLLVPGIAFRCATKLILPYLNGTNRPGVQSWATIACLITNYAALIVLYPRAGLAGAAIAMNAGYFVSGFILLVAFHRFSRMRIRKAWLPGWSDLNKVSEILMTFRTRLQRVGS
jgi:O-antigen/teichoic acid export membrane protein